MSMRPVQSEIRMHAVLRYIDPYISDPMLSVGSVAGGCGVSSYIFSLLKRQGTTFSALVWGKRLDLAREAA